MIRSVRVLSLFLLFVGIGFLDERAVAIAEVPVVDSADVKTSGPTTKIDLHFGMPMQYQKHTPLGKGDLLQIELRALGDPNQLSDLDRSMNLSWNRKSSGALTEISYEADATGRVQLLLRFAGEVYFNRLGSSDPRYLKIVVTRDVVETVPAEAKNRYAINLESKPAPLNLAALPQADVLKINQLYTTNFKQNGRLWYSLWLGFFADEQSANEVYERLKKDFPQAWVTVAPQSNRSLTREVFPPSSPAAARPEASVPSRKTGVVLHADPYEQALLDEGEAAMIAENYPRAVQVYTRLVQSVDPGVRQQALEFLGLARERNGQQAHARAEYETYLELYPEGEGFERVQQRLAGLLTARETPKEKLRKAKESETKDQWQREGYGSFSQFYDRDVTYTDSAGDIVNRNSLSTNLDANARLRNDNYDLRAAFVGGFENDFMADGKDESTISSLYVDALARRLDLSARIGRQTRSNGGVLGRFDGGLLHWQLHDVVALNLVGGFPVASATDTTIDTDRPFYGVSVDLGTFANRWNFSTYYITQNIEGMLDRQAVGGEVRYFDPSLSFFSLVDYDTSYKQLNTALLTANWLLPSKTSLNMSVDYRNSPILMTGNALQGQPVYDIGALQLLYTDDEIRQLALDRTATSTSYTLGITQPLTQKLQLSGDVTASRFSSTPASGGVAAQPGTDMEFYYSMQLIGSSLIKDGDIAILGARYSDSTSYNLYSASVNTRYPVTRNFRVNPRAVLDYRTNKYDDGRQWKFRPLLRLEYVLKRRYHFEFEGGAEWSSEQAAGVQDNRSGYFFTTGYRLDF
jgi:tetratricopeptide (TPR) repeat protein